MKRVIPAVSLLTLGAAAVATSAVARAEEGGTSPWKLSALVDGFYDNNIYGRSGAAGVPNARVGSFGFEFAPSVALNLPFNDGASKLIVKYDYSLKYYDARVEHISHAHRALVEFDHRFSDAVKIMLADKFTYSQEPAQNVPGGANYRTVGDNLINIADARIDVSVAPLWDVDLTYENTLVRFQDQALRAALDRMEHLPGFDVRYKITETASVLAGYQYRIVDYDNELRARSGNLTAHRPFAGLDNDWSPTLRSSLRVGIEAIDFDTPAGGTDRDTVEPYADASLTWDYATGSSATIGIKHEFMASDVFDPTDPFDPARGKEATTAYLSISHSITPDLTVSAAGGYQWGQTIGGHGFIPTGTPGLFQLIDLDGQSEDYAYLNVSARYRFNAYVSAFASYSLDLLTSGDNLRAVYPGRDFDRSVFKLGAILTY